MLAGVAILVVPGGLNGTIDPVGAILLFVGPAQIKGFAIVLAIGVLASLFSSIFVTHNLLAVVLNWTSARRESMR